jgi:hypothetical protein
VVVIVVAAWLAGPGAVATSIRRWLIPALRDRRVAYAGLAALFILILLWSPTEATRRLWPSLVLLGLFVVGLEALRAEAVAEFPDETGADARQRLANALSVRGMISRRRAAAPPSAAAPNGEDMRLERLERLAKLHDSGLLDDEELRREKERILTG